MIQCSSFFSTFFPSTSRHRSSANDQVIVREDRRQPKACRPRRTLAEHYKLSLTTERSRVLPQVSSVRVLLSSCVFSAVSLSVTPQTTVWRSWALLRGLFASCVRRKNKVVISNDWLERQFAILDTSTQHEMFQPNIRVF